MSLFVIGQRFDPAAARKRKIFVADIVDARRGLSDGAKRIYRRLESLVTSADRNKNPWLGWAYPSVEQLMDWLGKSKREIIRDLAVLRDAGLIEISRPNRQEGNRYYFLWHSWFDSSEVSTLTLQKPSPEVPTLAPRKGSEVPSEVPPEVPTLAPPIKEESEVYSIQESTTAVLVDSSGAAATELPEQQQKQVPSFESKTQNPAPEEQWTPERLEDACGVLAEFSEHHNPLFRPPDVPTLVNITTNMLDLDDLRLWINSSQEILRKSKTWGGYVSRARQWPAHRETTKALVANNKALTKPTIDPDRPGHLNPGLTGDDCPHGFWNGKGCTACEYDKLIDNVRGPQPPRPARPPQIHPDREKVREAMEPIRRQSDRWRIIQARQPERKRREMEAVRPRIFDNVGFEKREQILADLENGTSPWLQSGVA